MSNLFDRAYAALVESATPAIEVFKTNIEEIKDEVGKGITFFEVEVTGEVAKIREEISEEITEIEAKAAEIVDKVKTAINKNINKK